MSIRPPSGDRSPRHEEKAEEPSGTARPFIPKIKKAEGRTEKPQEQGAAATLAAKLAYVRDMLKYYTEKNQNNQYIHIPTADQLQYLRTYMVNLLPQFSGLDNPSAKLGIQANDVIADIARAQEIQAGGGTIGSEMGVLSAGIKHIEKHILPNLSGLNPQGLPALPTGTPAQQLLTLFLTLQTYLQDYASGNGGAIPANGLATLGLQFQQLIPLFPTPPNDPRVAEGLSCAAADCLKANISQTEDTGDGKGPAQHLADAINWANNANSIINPQPPPHSGGH